MFFTKLQIKSRAPVIQLQYQCRMLLSTHRDLERNKSCRKSSESTNPSLFHELKTLSTSHNWRRAADFIATNEFDCTRSSLYIFNNLIKQAFSNVDHQLGWEMLNKICANNFQPDCQSFVAYWDYCTIDKSTFTANVEKMLEFIANNQMIISKSAIEELSHRIQHFGGSAAPTNINTENCACEKCQCHLPEINHSALEFQTLKREFEKKLIKSKISSDELFVFRQLFNKKRTYDYVIDALNVTRVFPESKGNILKQGNLLARLVEQLRVQKGRVFVVGKKHVNLWPEQSINSVRKSATVYLTKDAGSDDDLLMMYAAFISGHNAHFISNDLFDEYHNELSEKGGESFRKWQKQHQHFVSYDIEKDIIHIHRPNRFVGNANKDAQNGYWHVPYTDRPLMYSLKGLIRVPIRWGCIKLPTNH